MKLAARPHALQEGEGGMVAAPQLIAKSLGSLIALWRVAHWQGGRMSKSIGIPSAEAGRVMGAVPMSSIILPTRPYTLKPGP